MKNGKIGVGLIGVHPSRGWVMTAHIPALQTSPDFEIVTLPNSNLDVANEAASKFSVPQAFQHQEELLGTPSAGGDVTNRGRYPSSPVQLC